MFHFFTFALNGSLFINKKKGEDMPLVRKIRDIMVPIAEYATTGPETTLKEAVLNLRKIYCEVETGECTYV